MPVNHLYRLVVRGSLHGQKTINVFHYIMSVAGTDTPVNLITAFETSVVPSWRNAVSQEWSLVDIFAQRFVPTPPSVGFVSVAAANPGLVTGDSLPTSVAVVITKRTALAGRKYRGRAFISGVAFSHENNSQVSAGGLLLFNVLAANLDNVLSANGDSYTPVLFHKQSNGFDVITECEARPVMRNQRRRQIGKGV